MRTSRSYLSVLLATLALVLASSATALTQEKENPKVSIKNFGQLDERFFRGAQPKEDEFKELAALGIKTVIDLREDPEEYEKRNVEALGMRYVNIPMIAKKYPTETAVKTFLETVENPDTGKFYIHCAGGRHRTGAMGAVYRYKFYDWNFEQVYKEMKQFDFYTSWGHGAFKDFVKDYYEQIQTTKTSAPGAADTEKALEKAMDKK